MWATASSELIVFLSVKLAQVRIIRDLSHLCLHLFAPHVGMGKVGVTKGTLVSFIFVQ